MSETEIHPFNPIVPDSEVERLWFKLKHTRLPKEPIVPDAGEDYGAPLDWVKKLHDNWVESYSWSTAQREIASWSHFTTRIEHQRIHFIHQRAKPSSSSSAKPIPLLLIHGWPGTFYEFAHVIDPLTSPSSPDAPAFDLVIPSLPGFCWSHGPPRGWTLQDTARIFDTLMQRLGYDRYCAQGGDWAHWVVRELGARYSDRCVAVHTNMCPAEPPAGAGEQLTAREKFAQERNKWFLGEKGKEGHMGYAVMMRTRPQTIGVAFYDNPVGIMMWVGEKYNEIVDPALATLENRQFTADILTTICLYFFTGCIMTSMLPYYENVRHEDYVEFNQRPENRVKAAMGVSSFKWDVAPVSERSAATTGNLKWFREYDHGGHFAALESPDEFVSDMRDFYGKWYKA